MPELKPVVFTCDTCGFQCPSCLARARATRLRKSRYKKTWRRAHSREITLRRKVEAVKCAGLEHLLRFTVTDSSRPGCLIWTGRFAASYTKPKPVVTYGEYGSMLADRAMWAALGRPGLVGRNYLRTSCGHADCISGDHLYLTNQTQERARAAISP